MNRLIRKVKKINFKLLETLAIALWRLARLIRKIGYNFDVVENDRQNGVPCYNKECEFFFDEPEAQNCGGEYTDGDPCVSRCKRYKPAKNGSVRK
jgi:hypothetical protein